MHFKYTENDKKRFWAKVRRTSDADDLCWEWMGKRDDHEYGRFYHAQYGTRAAHIVSWEIANGKKVPKGLVVKHECDNRGCVRPSHLVADTQLANMRDAAARNRTSGAKLTAEKVREIRELAAAGMLLVDLAREFGVTVQAVSNVVKRKTWKHVF